MTRNLRISLGQMDIRLGQPESNLAKARQFAAEASRAGSDILVLPELWSTGYDLPNSDRYGSSLDKGMFAAMADLAKSYEIALVGSCLSKLAPQQYGNTAAFFNKHGTLLVDYSKIHLFPLMDEDRFLTPGNRIVKADTQWGSIGLAICYDLRFPELFRWLALSGCQVVIVPSEWPKPRISHWRTLLRARAIENQMFIAACNRVGQSQKYDFFGQSIIIDPMGEIVIEGDDCEGVLTAEIDLDVVDQVRNHIPVFKDRRPDVY